MTLPPGAHEAARRHLEERIEAFIAGHEASGQPPDAFAGEYLVRALASLKAGDYAAGEARLRLAETPAERRSPEDIARVPTGYALLSTAELRRSFERTKLGQLR
ncbi:MAG: hypothetical protein EPO55_22150 [Reyranella sp.]|uniref:hypothetical protein n=1 Tax=Reyranella sp. TaxID=1929291 RepID=UPI0012002EF5|nr:hypothetical protein [Reyranella sp.]TAJ36400.1 MAG: hypothetical protein EPO55_22150 [Reyranella sp.]